MTKFKLSVLVPTLTDRREFLEAMLDSLHLSPKELLDQTEIMLNMDNGTKTVGQKRNELLQRANGEYVVFIDDDDVVTADYLIEIFKGIQHGVDHIGISMLYKPDIGYERIVHCSKDYPWCEADGRYYRSAQHVCPIKASIAKKIKFPHIRYGEDRDYSHHVTPLIQTEYLIHHPIYIYQYRTQKKRGYE
jgi:glycosyltransferase involved in cell wall biosynthesis